MDFAVVNSPAAPVRRKPAHSKEMVSQLLFGETVKILKTRGDLWVKIRSLHDGYEGWMTRSLLAPIDETTANRMSEYVTTDILSTLSSGDVRINVPVGSSLTQFANGNGVVGDMTYSFSGNYVNRNNQEHDVQTIRKHCLPWLNAPYMWGGRTPLGVDCSGMVQVIYKLLGTDLPRDAWQQAQEGRAVKKFDMIKPGDLAFFDRGEEIVHVGILLENDQLIHASGKVKIDTLTKKGIIDSITGKRILKLQAIRRILD